MKLKKSKMLFSAVVVTFIIGICVLFHEKLRRKLTFHIGIEYNKHSKFINRAEKEIPQTAPNDSNLEIQEMTNITTSEKHAVGNVNIPLTLPSDASNITDKPLWRFLEMEMSKMTIHIGMVRNIAWLDTRETISDTPTLRLHFIMRKPARVNINDVILKMFKITLKKGNEESEYASVTLSHYQTHLLSRMLRTVNRRKYLEYLASFPIPRNYSLEDIDSTIDLNVHLTNLNKNILLQGIPIGYSTPLDMNTTSSEKEQFVVCVKPLYGNFSKDKDNFFIEWMEFNQILGVKEIHIYNNSWIISDRMTKIIKFYCDQNILYIHQFKQPFTQLFKSKTIQKPESSFEYDSMGITQRAAINTCFYENMNRFQYMLSIDLDEILVPQIHANYHNMFNSFNNSLKGNISSISAYYGQFYTFFNKTNHDSNLLTMQYRTYKDVSRTINSCTKETDTFDKRKSFVSTKFCMYADNHWCEVGPVNSRKVINPRKALTHHYRETCKWQLNCKIEHTRQNAAIYRFKRTLEKRVLLANEEINN